MAKKKGATMSDVARAAGVSQPTVSMILNNKPDVSFPQDTVNRVLAAAEKLRYAIPSSTYNQLPHNTKTILVLAVKSTNHYYSAMVQSIERSSREQGYRVLVCNTYHMTELEESYLLLAEEMHFVGIIFLYPPDNQEAFQRTSSIIPTVVICDQVSKMKTDIVELDNKKSGSIAAEHLLSLGHQRFAFISATPNNNTGRAMRLGGVTERLKANGMEKNLLLLLEEDNLNTSLHQLDYAYQIGFTLAQDERLYNNNITAVICVDDMVAFGVMDGILKNGYQIPEDFSVIGFDNVMYSGYARISLTTVDHHMELIAQSALDLLFNRLKSPLSESVINIGLARFKFECKPNIIVRGSTAPVKSSKRLYSESL